MKKQINEQINQDQNVWMTTSRMETLTDGIFAIAMTLLVLTLSVPQVSHPVTNAAMLQGFALVYPQFYAYALSFVLLAVFWRVNHSQFYSIKKFDQTLLWINIIWLMFVVLIPFSTELISDYGSNQMAMIFFHLNMFFIGAFFTLNWYYADRKNFIDENLDQKQIAASKKANLVFPLVALIAMALTFISPSWSSLAYFLIYFARKIV